MTLDDMPAERSPCWSGKLKVHNRIGFETGESRARDSFGSKVGGKARRKSIWLDVQRCEADATNGNRVAGGEATNECCWRADGDPRDSSVGHDAEDGSRGFDQAGEHSYRVTRRTRRERLRSRRFRVTGKTVLSGFQRERLLLRSRLGGRSLSKLGMPLKVVGGEGADDIDAQMIIAGVFESGSHEHSGYTSSTENGRNLCVKEGNPAAIIGLEVEVGKFAIFFVLESAGRDFVGGAHGRGLFKITTQRRDGFGRRGGGRW